MALDRPNLEGYVGGDEDFGFLANFHGHMGVNLEGDASIASDQLWRANIRKGVETDEGGAFPRTDHAVHEPYGAEVEN